MLKDFFPQSPTHTFNSVKSKVDTYYQTQGTFVSKDDLDMDPRVQQKILDNIQNK